MELTPHNTPKYSMKDIKRDNAKWRKRVRDHARGLTDEGLREYIRQTQDSLDVTENVAVGLTERARLKLLNAELDLRTRRK